MALRALIKAEVRKAPDQTSVAQLYRAIVKEIPRVLVIYDVDMPIKTAREAVRYHFNKFGSVQDGRVVGILLAKGYMELEETLMQWKQKTHLLRLLEPMDLEPDKYANLTLRQKLIYNVRDEE